MIQNQQRRQAYYALALLPAFVLLSRLSGTAAGMTIFLFAGAWGALIFFLRWILPQVYIPGQTRRTRQIIKGYAVMGAVFCLAIQYVIGAFLNQLAASSYDTSAWGLLYNSARVIPALIAREMVRAYGLGSLGRGGRKGLWAVLITAVLFLAELNLGKLLQTTNLKTGFIYLAATVAPDLALQALLSVLVIYGGAGAAIIYAVILKAFQFSFPILPNLPWIAQSAAGICFPLILILLISERGREAVTDTVNRKKEGAAGFLAALLAAVAFLWFSVGVFPVYPSVVLTGSMEPLIYPGDVVLIQKISAEKDINNLTEGEVINFKRGRITITHRIMAVTRDEAGNLSFQTKGDNNDSADVQPVLPNDIKGTVKHTVPKVGLPILILKSGTEVPEGVVDGEE